MSSRQPRNFESTTMLSPSPSQEPPCLRRGAQRSSLKRWEIPASEGAWRHGLPPPNCLTEECLHPPHPPARPPCSLEPLRPALARARPYRGVCAAVALGTFRRKMLGGVGRQTGWGRLHTHHGWVGRPGPQYSLAHPARRTPFLVSTLRPREGVECGPLQGAWHTDVPVRPPSCQGVLSVPREFLDRLHHLASEPLPPSP